MKHTHTDMWCSIIVMASIVMFGANTEAKADNGTGNSMEDFRENEETSFEKKSFASRWNISGYVEIAAQRSFDKIGSRSSNPLSDYPAWDLRLPKSSIWAEFDCGRGWSLGTQVEFTNGGTVAMRGIGNSRTRPMAWDQELELSELWVQKSFSAAANLKIGLIGTPVGRQNDYPTQFFGVIRPEDGPGFLALNNQSPAIDFNGEKGDWAYDVMFIPGFVDYEFGNGAWRYGRAGEDAYTRTIDRLYAGAFRVDNSSVPGLTIGLSGEFGAGHSWQNYGDDEDAPSRELKSTLTAAALDWEYDDNNVIFRGAYQFGYLSNKLRREAPEMSRIPVRDLCAMSLGAEFGYDLFSLNQKLAGRQKLYAFARYDWSNYRNCNAPENKGKCFNTDCQRFSVGVNWFPISSIIIKGEVGFGFDADPSRLFTGLSIAWQPSFP